jgi:queuosine precursor transporter
MRQLEMPLGVKRSPVRLPDPRVLGAGAVWVIAVYIGAQMLADIASLKIGLIAGLAVDMGTFIYPVTFTLRDLAHKTAGKRAAQAMILAAGFLNFLMALYLHWSALMPSDPDWGLHAEFAAVLAPMWRIVLASIAAEVISEMIDTEMYEWFVTRVTRRHHWARVLFSNNVSVPVDNAIFTVVAFGWTLPWNVVWEIFVVNLVVKYVVTLFSIPLIYCVREPPPPEDRDSSEHRSWNSRVVWPKDGL